MPTLLIEPITHSMHISEPMLGTAFSCYFMYAITQVPAGLFIDYFGPRRMLTIASVLVIGISCFAAAVSLWLLFVGRILIGVGSAFVVVLRLREYGSKIRFPLMVSLTNSVGMLGALFGLGPLNWVVSNVGWRLSLWGGF